MARAMEGSQDSGLGEQSRKHVLSDSQAENSPFLQPLQQYWGLRTGIRGNTVLNVHILFSLSPNHVTWTLNQGLKTYTYFCLCSLSIRLKQSWVPIQAPNWGLNQPASCYFTNSLLMTVVPLLSSASLSLLMPNALPPARFAISLRHIRRLQAAASLSSPGGWVTWFDGVRRHFL